MASKITQFSILSPSSMSGRWKKDDVIQEMKEVLGMDDAEISQDDTRWLEYVMGHAIDDQIEGTGAFIDQVTTLAKSSLYAKVRYEFPSGERISVELH